MSVYPSFTQILLSVYVTLQETAASFFGDLNYIMFATFLLFSVFSFFSVPIFPPRLSHELASRKPKPHLLMSKLMTLS